MQAYFFAFKTSKHFNKVGKQFWFTGLHKKLTIPSDHKKSNNGDKILDNGDKILQLTKNQLKDLVYKMVLEAIKPLQSEIIDLKTEIAQLRESQEFLSGQHDSLNKNYNNAVKVNNKQRQETRKLSQCTNDLKKQRNNEKLKVHELEQYDRRQNLIFEGVPQFQNESVTEIIIYPWQVNSMLI